MRTVRVNLRACGVVGIDNPYETDSFETSINGTEAEISKYYRDKVFNMGLWYDGEGNEHEDSLMRVTDIEFTDYDTH